ADNGDDGAPEIFEAGGIEDDVAPRAFDVAENPARLRGVDPRPADDGDGGERAQGVPAEIGQEGAGEAQAERLSVGGSEVGDKPLDGKPGHSHFDQERDELGNPAADEAEHDDGGNRAEV